MPATINIQATATVPEPFGSITLGPLTVTGTIAPVLASLTLVSGNNTITVPAGAAGVIITPPASNAIVLKYKTTAGDVGVNVPQGAASFFIFDTTNLPASIIVNAASLTTGVTQVVFF